MKVLRDTAEWAVALAELPAEAPLPARTAIVPSELAAHALRRALLEAGRAACLVGTRFVTVAEAARETLRAAGVPFAAGEERLRPLRVAALRPAWTPAWTQAFARTIGSLEAAGARPDAGEAAALWAELDAAAGTSLTAARAIGAATGRPWPFSGPTLAVLGGDESAVARRFLSEIPGVVLAESRPDRRRVDGVELYAGVDEEVTAAARWAAEQAGRVPLDEIAVLVPRRDPWSVIVADRLARAGVPAVVHGGVPATATGAAARTLALLRALGRHLPVGALAGLLPALRAGEGHLSAGRALALAQTLGTLGGSPVDPAGALAWGERARARLAALRERVASGEETHVEEVARRAADLEAILPALEALVELARAVIEGARPFEPLLAFVDRWLLRPGADGAVWPAVLGEAMAGLLADPLGASLSGTAALAAAEAIVASARLPRGRVGEAAVTVATIEEAQHLRWRAARVLGLCEGGFPRAPGEDPLIPPELRGRVPGPAEALAAQRRALERVMANATDVALSAPLCDVDGSAREPSALLVELAARFEPRTVAPLDSAGPRPAPLQASGGALEADGFAVELDEVPGLSPNRPLSSRQLERLLRCPHLYLRQDILGMRPPVEERPGAELDPMSYGSLVHAAAEAFYRAHGRAFGERERTLEEWQAVAARVADETLAALAEEHALAGPAVRAQVAARVHRDLLAFLEHDFGDGRPRRFVAVEEPFGFDAPFTVDAGGRTLHVRGVIDRLDVEEGRLLVRDLKTGRAHPRQGEEIDPSPERDLQIALYGRVAARLAQAHGARGVALAYVYPAARGERERAFRDDVDELDRELSRWLEIAGGLLEARAFPRTPDPRDCERCAFRPVCGPGAQERDAARLRAEASGPLASFYAWKVRA